MYTDAKFLAHPMWSKIGQRGEHCRVGNTARIYGEASNLKLGDCVRIDDNTAIMAFSHVILGNNVTIGWGSVIEAFSQVKINDGVILMPGVKIMTRYPTPGNVLETGDIEIGSGSIIGANSVLLPGFKSPSLSDISPCSVER